MPWRVVHHRLVARTRTPHKSPLSTRYPRTHRLVDPVRRNLHRQIAREKGVGMITRDQEEPLESFTAGPGFWLELLPSSAVEFSTEWRTPEAVAVADDPGLGEVLAD